MDFQDFKEQISKKFGLNLSGYKEKQLKRRIEHLMNSQGYHNFNDYYRVLLVDKSQKAKFLDKLTINVSEFFRNKDIFAKLEKEIIPMLLKENNKLKIWSAGCSNGAEAYSVSIILDQISPKTNHIIHASDIDEKILEDAKRAIYREELLKNISEERREKYFTPIGDYYQIKNDIKGKVSFFKHDLLKDKYGKDYDLIICRNVTIYFTRDTQNSLYNNFKDALRPGGILFIGATESILNYHQLGFNKISAWFYQKPSD